MEGTFKAVMTTRESHSMMKFLSCNEATREAAKRAARASPKFGSQVGQICEQALMMVPV
jgi:hypothetical protein